MATDCSDLIHDFATLTSAQLGLRFDQINKCLQRGSCANVCEKGMACGFRNLQVRTGGLGARTSQQPTPITFHTRLRVELSSRLETVVRHHGEVSRSAVPAQVWLSTRSRAPLTDRSSLLRPVNRFGTFAK